MGRASKALLAPRAAMLFLIKLGAYLVVVVLFGVSVFVIYHGMERDVLLQFQALQQVDPLIEAKKLVEAGELCEALDYLDYFREYDYVKSDPRVAEFYDSIKQQRESYAYRAGDVFSGVWKGRGACFESLVAAAASDFVVVGDLRDLAWQGWNLYQGNDPDELTAALAGIGIVLAAATYGSGGAASPAKGVVSLLKTGNKLKKISAPLRKSLTALSREASKMRSLEPLEPAFSSIARIAKKKELKTRDLMEVLSRSKSVSELQFMENVAAAYGSKTGKYLRLGGDSPVKIVKKFGRSRKLIEATDNAVQFGPKGARLLEQVGPSRFMMYLKMTKYGVRGLRSVWEARLTMLVAWFLKLFPQWAVFAMAAMTGSIAIGVPVRLSFRRLARLRRPQTPAACHTLQGFR